MIVACVYFSEFEIHFDSLYFLDIVDIKECSSEKKHCIILYDY
jgi:hypothetical protein